MRENDELRWRLKITRAHALVATRLIRLCCTWSVIPLPLFITSHDQPRVFNQSLLFQFDHWSHPTTRVKPNVIYFVETFYALIASDCDQLLFYFLLQSYTRSIKKKKICKIHRKTMWKDVKSNIESIHFVPFLGNFLFYHFYHFLSIINLVVFWILFYSTESKFVYLFFIIIVSELIGFIVIRLIIKNNYQSLRYDV